MLVLEKIVKSYNVGNDNIKVIDQLSLSLPDIGFIGIKGESGSGKSTLLNIISGIEKPDTGFILFDGNLIADDYLKEKVSIVFQNNDLLTYLNVKENILIGAKIASMKYSKKKFDYIVDKLDLRNHLYKYSNQLSLGQIKRVSIARGILKDSSIMLCDEPTGALHSEQAREIMQLLKDVSNDRLVIIVSHDSMLLEEFCDDVLVLKNGKVKGKVVENKLTKKEEKSYKKYSLLFCAIKRMLKDKYILLFMFVFEIIIIVSLFLITSGMSGIENRLDKDYQNSPEKNILKLEQYNNEFFEEPLKDNYSYDYILSLGELSIDSDMKFLPKKCNYVELYEGTLPLNNNQVLASYELKNRLNNNIVYKYNNQEIQLQVVGILEESYFKEKCIYFYNGFKDIIPNYVNKSVVVYECENSIDMYDELSKDYIVYNEPIERLNSYKSLLYIARMISYIFFGISLLCSFFLFYIIYQTLGIKRKHDYALLLMYGLSVYELFYLAIIESIFIGFLLSLIGNIVSLILFYYLNNVVCIESIFFFKLEIDSFYFVFMHIIYVLLSVTSGYLPTKKIIDNSLIKLLREEE